MKTDEGKLRQISINLLSNASKFTEQGSVQVRVKLLEDERLNFEQQFSGNKQPTPLYFEVEDTGFGIAPTELNKLFDNSAIGRGSTFGFDIHIDRPELSEIATPTKYPKVIGLAPDQPQYRILLVEERLENRLLLMKILSR